MAEGNGSNGGRDRGVITLLLLVMSLLGNLALFGQMFVSRAEYTVTLKGVEARLAGIETRLGIYRPRRTTLTTPQAEDDE